MKSLSLSVETIKNLSIQFGQNLRYEVLKLLEAT